MENNKNISNIITLLEKDNASPALIAWFLDAFKQWASGLNNTISLKECSPVSLNQVDHLSSCDKEKLEKIARLNLKKLAVLKLNGGLGTSMGCTGPKSLVNFNASQTFLDIIMEHIKTLNASYECDIELLLMNSFYTDKQTKQYFKQLSVNSFLQDRVPKIDKLSKSALIDQQDESNWNPPGHGNAYLALHHSGMLDQLIAAGKEYLFISNSDNLGATVNQALFGYFIQSETEFLMEVTPKTKLDVKGGALVKKDNHYFLLEQAQVSKSEITSFESIETFSLFNTNNIWIHLPSFKNYIKNNQLKLPLIFNEKVVGNKPIIQFETAIGSAISFVEKAAVICVSRDRFLPVKKTTDLFLLQSSLFKKNNDGDITKVEKSKPLPEIQFDSSNLVLATFQKTFETIPDIKALTSLNLNGRFLFKDGVSLVGDVSLINNRPKPVVIQNKIIKNKSLRYD